MGKIIILRGNSGSGKTVVSKELQRKIGRGTFLIPQDFVRREMLFVKDYPGNPAVDLLLNLVLFGHENCEYVILEGILYSDIYARLFAKIKELFADEIYAYYFDLPFEETLRRHEQKAVSAEYGEAEMRRWWREKDFLRDIREERIFMDSSLEETVERIYREVVDGL